nr:MjaI family restriction endonuclease [Mycoplasmopsis bovis]
MKTKQNDDFRYEAIIQNSECLEKINFPKYFSPIVNLANQFTKATSPKNVGQLSELFKQYESYIKSQSSNLIPSVRNWEEYYETAVIEYGFSKDEAVDNAINKIFSMLKNFQNMLNSYDEQSLKNDVGVWVKKLMFEKTFTGLSVQKLNCWAYNKTYWLQLYFEDYQHASEESLNIDSILFNR